MGKNNERLNECKNVRMIRDAKQPYNFSTLQLFNLST